MEHQFSLEFKNVKVRPLSLNDIEYLRQWRNYSGNTKYLRKIGEITVEQQLSWFRRYLKNPDEICFAIDEVVELKKTVGSASLYDFREEQVEFGKIMVGTPEAHGRKIGYHSTIAIVAIAFTKLSLTRVILHCYKENCGALHIYDQVGFVIIDEHDGPKGVEYTMELTKEHFKQLHQD